MKRLQQKSEARRRTLRDGIPRYVDRNGKIWKYDWVAPDELEDSLTWEELEEHIAKLIAQQS